MSESLHHTGTTGGRNILASILLNITITAAQIAGGLISGSMALLSDAVHNFSDVLALFISYWAARISGREHTLRQTYGYKRAGIFAAFINSATLLVIGTVLIWEAVSRLIRPQPISGEIVIYLAALSIILNGISALLIKKDAAESINIRSAYLHLFTDMMTSIAVLLGGLAMKFFGWFWIDAVLSIGIAVYLILSSWGLFYESVRIFMQFTPYSIDIEDIAEKVTLIKGVKNMHHVHVWQLDDKEMMFEAHIDLEADYPISHFEDILDQVEKILEQCDIHHFNIQPELYRSDQKGLIDIGKHK